MDNHNIEVNGPRLFVRGDNDLGLVYIANVIVSFFPFSDRTGATAQLKDALTKVIENRPKDPVEFLSD